MRIAAKPKQPLIMKNVFPKVSVIIPVFNRDWCITDAIQSVLDTEYPELEILVIDDGSKDGTPAILDNFQKNYASSIKILHHPEGKNLGAAASRNLGLKHSSGKYVAFLDSDDIFYPNRFTYCIPWLENEPSILAGIEPYCISHFGKGENKIFFQHLTYVKNSEDFFKIMLNENVFWKTPTVTFRKQIFSLIGNFDENFRFGEETSLWLRTSALGLVAAIQKENAVCEIRRHENRLHNPNRRSAILTYYKILLSTSKWAKKNKIILRKQEIILFCLLKKIIIFYNQTSKFKEFSISDRIDFLYQVTKIFPTFILDKAFFKIVWNIIKFSKKS